MCRTTWKTLLWGFPLIRKWNSSTIYVLACIYFITVEFSAALNNVTDLMLGSIMVGGKQCRALGRHESPKVAHFPFTSGAKTCTDCELKSQSHGWEAPDSHNVMNNFTYAYDHNNLELQWRDKANSQVHMYAEYRPQIVHCFPHPQTMSQQSGPFLAASVLGTSVLESHEALSCWGSVGK